MKIKLINPTLHDATHATPAVVQSNPAVGAPPPGARQVFTLGLDVDLRFWDKGVTSGDWSESSSITVGPA